MNELEKLQAEFLAFANVGIQTIGVAATTQVLTTLSALITEEPELSKKLADPTTQAKLLEMSKQMKGKKIGPMELFTMLPQVKAIFN